MGNTLSKQVHGAAGATTRPGPVSPVRALCGYGLRSATSTFPVREVPDVGHLLSSRLQEYGPVLQNLNNPRRLQARLPLRRSCAGPCQVIANRPIITPMSQAKNPEDKCAECGHRRKVHHEFSTPHCIPDAEPG